MNEIQQNSGGEPLPSRQRSATQFEEQTSQDVKTTKTEGQLLNTAPGSKRKRESNTPYRRSCHNCQRAEIKCDRATPCSFCEDKNLVCTYPYCKRSTKPLNDADGAFPSTRGRPTARADPIANPREFSPEPYEDSEWARSHSPDAAVYSDDGRVLLRNADHLHSASADRNSPTHSYSSQWPYRESAALLVNEILNNDSAKFRTSEPTASSDPSQDLHTSPPHGCTMCSSSFSTLKLLRYHMCITHFGDKLMLCSRCMQRFEQYEAFLQHEQVCHLQKVHPLDEIDHESPGTCNDDHSSQYYRYSALNPSEVRLLRISPGEFEDSLICALKPILIEKLKECVLTFQALSYAWGDEASDESIVLSNLPRSHELDRLDSGQEQAGHYTFMLRRNLFQALKRIREPNRFIWLWVDAICIDQSDETDKSQQISRMPEIYSSAWNVIVWLGEDEQHPGDIQRAIQFISKLLNLRRLDLVLENMFLNSRSAHEWASFGQLLRRPWFTRRWVIQEVASARKLSVRIRDHILSWIDFTDAIDIYLHSIDRKHWPRSHSPSGSGGIELPSSLEYSRARTLLALSANIFQKSFDLEIQSRLHNLETLVLLASSFGVSEVRDTIYALKYLCNDTRTYVGTRVAHSYRNSIEGDYSVHPVHLFSEFIQYSLNVSKSLDIICRPWASWPCPQRTMTYLDRQLPGWIGVASFAGSNPLGRIKQSEVFLGPPGRSIYNASRGMPMQAAVSLPGTALLHAKGILLGSVYSVSSLISERGIPIDALQTLGWTHRIEDAFNEKIWRTLVANRTEDHKTAPAWYRRACALALMNMGVTKHILSFTEFDASISQPSFVKEYVDRARTVTAGRRSFQYFDGHGIGPADMMIEDKIVLLFGCSVPIVLRQQLPKRFGEDEGLYSFIGPCYVHGRMEGEVFISVTKEEIGMRSIHFKIT